MSFTLLPETGGWITMSKRISLLLLILLISSLYLYTAAGRAILDDGDALYAHIAQQMAKSDEWVTPYANGVRFLDKPPMMYWLMGLSYRVFGFNEFAASLPSALAVLGTALLLFLLGQRAGGHSAGLIAGLAFALSAGTFLFTRMVFPDALFVFLLTLAIFAFLRWYSEERSPLIPALLFYASLAGAVLSKGLIGLLFPLLIIALFLIWARDLRSLIRFHFWKGWILFIALALPWHWLAARRNPGFLWYYFVNEHLLRFLGKRQPVDYASISLPVFWGLVLLWLFPWSAFFPALRHLAGKFDWRQAKARPAVWISASWILVMLVFFSVSSRIEHYSMPIFPPLALLVGLALAPEALPGLTADTRRQNSIGRSFGFLAALGAILTVPVIILIAWTSGWFSGVLMRHSAEAHLHAYKFYFAPLFNMPEDVLKRLLVPACGTCLVLAGGLLCAWWMNRRGRRMSAVVMLSSMMVAFCLFAFQSLAICEGMISCRQFGQKLNQLYRPGDRAIIFGDFETANSLNFYSPMKLEVYEGTAALLQWGLRYPDAPACILSPEMFQKRWSAPQRRFLLAPDDRLESLKLDHAFVLMHFGGRTLLCNQKPE
jgi:4-amino-4-deoxy-L-arabinose transferase-like glycosyltransferase